MHRKQIVFDNSIWKQNMPLTEFNWEKSWLEVTYSFMNLTLCDYSYICKRNVNVLCYGVLISPYGSCIKYSIWTISHFYIIQILNYERYLIPSIWNRDCGTLSKNTLSYLKIEKTLHKQLENYSLTFMKAYRKCVSGGVHIVCLLRKTVMIIYESRILRDGKNYDNHVKEELDQTITNWI